MKWCGRIAEKREDFRSHLLVFHALNDRFIKRHVRKEQYISIEEIEI